MQMFVSLFVCLSVTKDLNELTGEFMGKMNLMVNSLFQIKAKHERTFKINSSVD